jgi:hypothetical protein
MTYVQVGSSTIKIINRIAKYFPRTICLGESGFVFNISKVPDLNSSDNVRIEIAGTRNKKTQGARSKNLSRLAYPYSKMLLSCKTNRNNPLINKNNTIEMYPIKLLKN